MTVPESVIGSTSPSYPRVCDLDVDVFPDRTATALDLEVSAPLRERHLTIPVRIVAGIGTRPRLVLVAGVHGDEYEGIFALADIARELDPCAILGRLVIVPVANPLAVSAGQRCAPADGRDLNRTFPGRANGSPTEMLADCLLNRVLRGADFVFSLHSWSASGSVVPYVEVHHDHPPTREASLKAATASGFGIIWPCEWPQGLMTHAVAELGIPAMEAEIGGCGMSTPCNRRRYKARVHALMSHLGMFGAAQHRPSMRPRLVTGIDIVSPGIGLLRPHVELGQAVDAGTSLATLHDCHGSCLHTMMAPCDGFVAALHNSAMTRTGELVARLFRDRDRSFAP